MQWINALSECTETTASATACFNADHFAVAGGAISEAALVECMAQTVAAALGHRALAKGRPDRARAGMLAAVSDFRIQTSPHLGKTLRIDVQERKRFGPMLLVSGVVSCEGETIASGELTLYA